MLVKAVAVAAKAQGLPFLLDRVRVTDCFEDDVNRLVDERSGHAAYVAARMSLPEGMRTQLVRPFGPAPRKES